MTIIDHRGQNDCQVSINGIIAASDDYVMAGVPEDRRKISDMNAGQILKHAPHILFKPRGK